MDRKTLISIINANFSFRDLLSAKGIYVKEGVQCCLFHVDSRPSARYFSKGDLMVCFTCSRRYTAYDVLIKYYNYDDCQLESMIYEKGLSGGVHQIEHKCIFKVDSDLPKIKRVFIEGKKSVEEYTKYVVEHLVES